MNSDTEILAHLESLEELNAPPPVLSDILHSVFQDFSLPGERQITRSKDPGLTTRMFRVADLSSTDFRKRVAEENAAAGSPTADGSRLLIASIAIYNELSRLGCIDCRIFPEVWRHSLLAANIAQDLACKIDPQLHEMAYLTGLLHDIGMIIVLRYYPVEASAIRDLVAEGVGLLEAERRIIKTDHQEVGSLVAERWNIPGTLKDVIGDHHPADSRIREGMSQLPLLTIAADALSPIYRECPAVDEDNGSRTELLGSCCRELGIAAVVSSAAYSILPKHLFQSVKSDDESNIDDPRNHIRMNNELFDLYSGLASRFRERQQLSRQLLQERYVKGTWESLNIVLSTISHYINNSMSIVSGESEILKHHYDMGDKEEALARIPDVTRAITRSSRRISILLDELSNITGPEELRYFKNSKAIDIQKVLEERLHTEVQQNP